jgi:hypothetical protein
MQEHLKRRLERIEEQNDRDLCVLQHQTELAARRLIDDGDRVAELSLLGQVRIATTLLDAQRPLAELEDRYPDAYRTWMVDEAQAQAAGSALLDIKAIRARVRERDGAASNHNDKPIVGGGMMGVVELAELNGITDPKAIDALRKKLDRWRKTHMNGEWMEVDPSYRRPNQPKYLFLPSAVAPVIADFKQRPANVRGKN